MAKNLLSAIRQAIDGYMESFETAFPGIIETVNADGTVDVIPSVRNCLTNMQLERGGGLLRAIPGVPVIYQGTAAAIVRLELKAGDPVLLIASSRDLTVWASEDWAKGPFNPLSFDGNDINNLVALPVRRLSHGDDKPKTTIEIKADGSIQVDASGDVTVKSPTVKLDADRAEITGDLEVKGGMKAATVTADGEVTANGSSVPVTLSKHTHSYISPAGSAVTGLPQ